MKTILKLALGLAFLLLPSVSEGKSAWPVLPDKRLLWQSNYDREGNLKDEASSVALKENMLFVAGETATTAGGSAFTVRAYSTRNGALLWEDNYDREGSLWDWGYKVVVSDKKVFVVGGTESAEGGSAFAVRAYNANNGKLLWKDNYDREGAFWDGAYDVVVRNDRVFVVGGTESAEGGSAFAVRAYNANNGELLWQDNHDRSGSLWDEAWSVAATDDKVFVAGGTETAEGGGAFTVRAYNVKDGKLLWQNNYDREGSLWDGAYSVAVKGNRVFVVGETESVAGGSAFSVRVYSANNGALLWEDNYDREGTLWDWAYNVAVKYDTVFVVGGTETTTGGNAFTVRAYNVANGALLWQDNYDREGGLSDGAYNLVVSGKKVFVVGKTETTTGGSAATVRGYNSASGSVVFETYYDREGSKWDGAYDVAYQGGKLFVAGGSETTAGGSAFAVRTYKVDVHLHDSYKREDD
jgi:TolB-like protein